MLSTATKAAANVTKTLAEHDVRSTLRDTARDIADTVEGRGRAAANTVSDYAHEASAKARGLFDRTVENGRSVTGKVENEIKANPIRASAIALGAGFLLGALLTRR